MPSGKISDGLLCKNIPDVSCEKNEEDKKQNIELFKKLDERRQKLEDMLLQKLEELKAECICEGELTGVMPLEIYKTLMPGEVEPKIKRRVGTTFKFSQQVLYCPNDETGQLEVDIELHRKIVAAAERLAKDKSANKSVRKKRRKDWQAANQRLKGLEKGLYKLRISNSKPDVSVNFESFLTSNNSSSGFSLNNLRGWTNFSSHILKNSTKSCPTTPRGSVLDLSVIDGGIRPKDGKHVENNNHINSKDSTKKANDFVKCPLIKMLPNSQTNEIEASSISCLPGAQLPPTIPLRRSHGSSLSVSSMSNRFQQSSQDLTELNESYFCDTPMYANVGYTSSVPYKSAYRQSNFPTIQDSKLSNLSNSCLNKNASTAFSTSFSVEKPFDENSVIDHSPNSLNFLRQVSESKTMNFSHQIQQQRCSSSSQSSAGSISIGSIASTASSSGYHSSTRHVDSLGCAVLDNRFTDLKQPSSSISSGFSTTSLDRRALKGSLSQSGLINSIENPKTLYSSRFRRENNLLITTFPVNDYCRPLELNDFNKYRSNSLVRANDSSSVVSGLKKSSISASGLPSNMLYNSIFSNNYHQHNYLKTGRNFPVLEADPRLTALLASIHSRSMKTNSSSLSNSVQSSAESNTVPTPLLNSFNDELIPSKTATTV